MANSGFQREALLKLLLYSTVSGHNQSTEYGIHFVQYMAVLTEHNYKNLLYGGIINLFETKNATKSQENIFVISKRAKKRVAMQCTSLPFLVFFAENLPLFLLYGEFKAYCVFLKW
jgi:hypothetical protein